MNFLRALHWKKVQACQSFTIWNHITYSLKVNNKGITLPVMGCAGIFSTFGVLDSAGNATVSFLAKKKKKSENKQFTSLPYNTVSKYNSLKTKSSNKLFPEFYLALIASHQQLTNLLCISTRD